MAQPGTKLAADRVSSLDINLKPHSNYLDTEGDRIEDLSEDLFLDSYTMQTD